ncbi:MAG: DUF885 domain-containing protein [Gammaproteobacteria bacterium]
MKAFLSVVFLLTTLTGTQAVAASAEDVRFEELAARFVDGFPVLSPVSATTLGDHRFDDRLDDISAAGRAAERAFLQDTLQALSDIDRSELSRANQIDAAMLANQLEYSLWSLDQLQEWAWNPLQYTQLAGGAVYSLMARDFAPLEERLDDLAGRLEAMPAFLAEVRATLQPARVPRVHAETAAQQNRGVLSILDDMVVPQLANVAPALKTRLEGAMAATREAVETHQAWLEEDLVPAAEGEFRLGAELFDRKLAYTLDSSLSRREIRERAQAEFQRVRDEMYQVALEVYRGKYPMVKVPESPAPEFRQAVIRAALEEVYRHLPGRDEIVEVARRQLAQTTEFVREKNLVEVPDDPIEIIIMPEFQRGVAVAYCDPPGPLDKGQKTFYAVAPLPEEWTDIQVESFLREYNLYSIQDLTIHEAMPGHYLQLAHSNRYPSVLRSVLWSGPFVEGWAVYAERVMIDNGYLDFDPLMRLTNLKWYLRAVTNAIIDQAIHVDGMDREAAMELMVEGGFQEEREAAGKWIRAQLTSAQLSTYFVGYQEHADLREEVERSWGEDFTLRRYHDTVLSFGSPPVRHVRSMILGTPVVASP